MNCVANIGGKNSGYWNSGDYNSGDSNAGSMNAGDFNAGDYNTGKGNSGSRNQGDYNAGDYNQGTYNTGDWNLCSYSTGAFCTAEENIRMFDKPSPYTYSQWLNSRACQIMRRARTAYWIEAQHMSAAEKRAHPEYIQNGGYLKTYTIQEACQNLWQQLSAEDKAEIMRLPNFDGKIFERITGICLHA